MIMSPRIQRISLLLRCVLRSVLMGRAKKLPRRLSKIIVVPTGKLGDVVCNTPVLVAIRAKLPNCQIVVGGNIKLHQAVLADSGLVDEYLDFEGPNVIQKIKTLGAEAAVVTGPAYQSVALLVAAGVPLVVAPKVEGGFSPAETRPYKILQRLIKTIPYRMGEYAPRERLRALEPLGVFSDDSTKHLGFSPAGAQVVEQFFLKHDLNPEKDFLVAISPAAGNKIKEWPVERFAQVADYLYKKHKAKILITGGKNDHQTTQLLVNSLSKETKFINTTGVFNLDELKAFASHLSLLVSVDSGPIYIAEAFNVPTIDITGPIDEKEQPPRGLWHRNVIPPHRSRPELYVLNAKHYNQAEAFRQVQSITVEMVIKEIDILVKELAKKFRK